MPTFDKTDIRHQGAYSLAEAARYLKLPQATLRARASGGDYPVVEGQGRLQALLDAGESVADLAADYDVTPADIEQAAHFQRAA